MRFALAALLILAACSSPSGEVPSDAPSSAASVEPSSAASASQADSTLLGNFDLDQFEAMFDTTFTTATVEGDLIRYDGEVGEVSFDFMVDPEDETGEIIQTSFTVDDISVEPTDAEIEALAAWGDYVRPYQPDALDWIHQHLDDYVSAPGAEMNVQERFGRANAGFFTLVPFSTDPVLGAPATLVGFYVEDWELLGR